MASGTRARIADSSRSRSASRRAHSSSRSATASSAAQRESDGHRDVLRARPAAAVLRAAEQQRLDRRAAPDEQRADPLRRADLVPGDATGGRTACVCASISTLPNACTASVWNTTPAASRLLGHRGHDRCTVPISLFTHITEHTAASSRTSASNDAASTTAVAESTASRRSSPPSLAIWCTRAEHGLVLDRRRTPRPCGLPRRAARARRRGAPCCPPRCRTR